MKRPSKKLIFLLVFLVVGWAGWLYLAPVKFEQDSLYIQSGTRLWPIDIEIARSVAQKEQGLMHRRRLLKNTGMLFVHEKPQISRMWMKDTLIPLDMLFINERGTIIHIAQNTRPRSKKLISHDEPALAVLEVPGGTTKDLMIKPGDSVIYPLFNPVERRK